MALLTLVAILAVAAQANAGPKLYVDAASIGGRCSDSRSAARAGAPRTPLCSISRALRVAGAGSRIIVRAGSYPQIRVDGYSRTSYVSVEAFAGEAVSVAGVKISDADHLRIQGLRITSRFDVVGTDHDIQIVGNDIGDQRSGLFIYGEDAGSTNITIEGNTIHDIDYPESDSTASGEGYGIQMIGRVSNVLIERNTIRSVVEDYIQGGGTNITVTRNTFLGPSKRYGHSELVHADLWQIFGSSRHIVFSDNVARNTGTQNGLLFQFNGPDQPHQDVQIVNNVFDHASDGTEMQIYNTNGLRIANNTAVGSKTGTLLRYDDRVAPGSDYRIVNNIFQATGGNPLSIERNWGVEDHNLIVRRGRSHRGYGRHDIVGRSPRFVDAGAGDYHLRPRSPGVNAGTPDGATPSSIDRVARDARPDMGAYEARGGRGSSGPSPKRRAAPAIAGLRVVPRRLRVARGHHAGHRGAALRFRLSRSARVRVSFRRVSGRRSVAVKGRFVAQGRKGANRVRFRGRVGRRWLRPGRYVASARARAGGRTSAPARTTFVVRR